MYRSTLMCIALLSVLVGCSAERTSSPSDSSAGASPTSSTPPEANGDSTEVAPQPAPVATTERQPLPKLELPPPSLPEYTSPKEYLEAALRELNRSAVTKGGPPSPEGINHAIQLCDSGREKFPDEMSLLNASVTVRYNTLQLEPDERIKTERQLEIGTLARECIQRDPKLATEFSVLLLEEAKAHVANNDLKTALKTIAEARELGFTQLHYVFMMPSLEPLRADSNSLPTLMGWLEEAVQNKLNEPSPFSFEFSLPSLTSPGETISLDDFRGKTVLVDFWGTWCGPCLDTIPHLIELQEEHPDDLAVIGINYEAPGGEPASFAETKSRLDSFTQLHPLPYPCVHGRTRTKLKVPGFRGFPTLLALDREGKVRYPITGYQPPEVLRTIVKQLIAE